MSEEEITENKDAGEKEAKVSTLELGGAFAEIAKASEDGGEDEQDKTEQAEGEDDEAGADEEARAEDGEEAAGRDDGEDGDSDDAETRGDVDDADTPLIKKLRRENRRRAREVRRLREKLNSLSAEAGGGANGVENSDAPPDIYEFDDDDKYKAALNAWLDKQTEAKLKEKEAERQLEEMNAEFERGKAQFPAEDFSDAEAEVQETLSDIQLQIIKHAARGGNPAEAVFLLGNDPEALENLANEQDPVKFTFKVAEFLAVKRQESTGKTESSRPRKRDAAGKFKPEAIPRKVGAGSQASAEKKMQKAVEAFANGGLDLT